MRESNDYELESEADAIVQHVDLINRELTALVEGVLVSIYAPPACDVVLRGERVKFRLVQPRDRVRVSYTQSDNTLIASAIEVQPSPSAWLHSQGSLRYPAGRF